MNQPLPCQRGSDAAVVGKVRFHQVVVEAAPGYLTQFGQTMPLRQRQVLQTILRCRTPALGGQLFACPACRTHHFRYHSCNHRFCPQCGQTDAQEWLARQQQRLLLPVPYFLVTFTVPEGLRAWMRSHPKLAYDLLFAASAQATQELGRNPKRLGALLGMLGVLHTWSRTLIFHPHIHYLVPAGGLSPDLLRWVGTRKPDYFLNEFALADRCRNLLGQMLQHQAPQEFKSIPAKVWKQRWRVQCKAAGSGQAALVYLSRYVFKTATANRWVERLADGRVRWPYRDSNTGQWMHLDLEPSELLRRYLQHVLPKGFTRVRAFGWFHPAGRQNLNRVRALLGTAPLLSAQECAAWLEQADLDDDQQPEPSAEAPKTDTPATTSTPVPAPLCPRCRQPMQLLAQWRRGGLLPLLAIARAPP